MSWAHSGHSNLVPPSNRPSAVHLDAQALASEVVDQVEDPEALPMRKLVRHEVQFPVSRSVASTRSN